MDDKTPAREAMQELTLVLLYLASWTEKHLIDGGDAHFAWKGHDWETLNGLEDEDLVRQGKNRSRTKSLYITRAGVSRARELLEKYGIKDWD